MMRRLAPSCLPSRLGTTTPRWQTFSSHEDCLKKEAPDEQGSVIHYARLQVTQIVIDKVIVNYVNIVGVLCGKISECNTT